VDTVDTPVLSSDESDEVVVETPTITQSPTPQVLGETTDNFPWPIFILLGGLLGSCAFLIYRNWIATRVHSQ
jgi:hypothetical protein